MSALRRAAVPLLLVGLVTAVTVRADAGTPTRLTWVQTDGTGDGEWVRITNRGVRPRLLSGWTLRDRGNHVYRFPRFELAPDTSVRVHTGAGQDTGTDLYWDVEGDVWDDSGDTAVLRDRRGVRVDSCAWTAAAATIC